MSSLLTVPDSDYRKAELLARSGTASPQVWENFDLAFAYSNGATIPASGVMGSYGIFLPVGAVITSILFRSGTSGATTPANYWFALYDTALNLMSQTADQTTTAWAANTTKDIALGAVQTITLAGWYYAAIMVKAAGQPNMQGVNNAASITTSGYVANKGATAQTSGSALTTTAPASIATPASTGVMVPHVELH